jgi:Domain of unknown function (DUF305)
MTLRFPIELRGLLLAVGLGIGGMACVSPAAVAANPEGPFLALNDIAMNKMMAGMAVKPVGDADRDFVAMMVPHHQGAIDMAQAELQYGHNEKLLRIAQQIVVEQLQEIAAKRLAIGRGENYVDVLDGKTAEEKTGIVTPAGRGMNIFSPSDKYGYVCSSFNPVTDMVTVASHKIVATVKLTSPFCPNIAATPDSKQVWNTLKDTGRT